MIVLYDWPIAQNPAFDYNSSYAISNYVDHDPAFPNMLEDYDSAYGLKYVSLRYFNAAGADLNGRLGERHDPETHLIPLVLQTLSGRREVLSIFGDDYQTRDGTCIRDYVHVQDLCEAHVLALNHLKITHSSDQFNLGNGLGFSVREVIDEAREITGRSIDVKVEVSYKGLYLTFIQIVNTNNYFLSTIQFCMCCRKVKKYVCFIN